MRHSPYGPLGFLKSILFYGPGLNLSDFAQFSRVWFQQFCFESLVLKNYTTTPRCRSGTPAHEKGREGEICQRGTKAKLTLVVDPSSEEECLSTAEPLQFLPDYRMEQNIGCCRTPSTPG